MQIDIHKHDIAELLGATAEPAILFQRRPEDADPKTGSRGDWWTIQGPIIGGTLSWSVDRKSDRVRVPMIRHALKDKSPETLVQFGLQFSALAVECGREKLGQDPRRVFIGFSSVLDGEADNHLVYVGVSFLK